MEKSRGKKLALFIMRAIPILCVIAVIFFLTTQPPYDTRRLSDILQEFFLSVFPDSTSRWTYDMHYFRSLLHLPLYFMLGLSTGLSLRYLLKAVGICSVIAIADETFKIYLPTREFDLFDLSLDFIGFVAGIVVAAAIKAIWGHFRQSEG